jgi:hypothetical protein
VISAADKNNNKLFNSSINKLWKLIVGCLRMFICGSLVLVCSMVPTFARFIGLLLSDMHMECRIGMQLVWNKLSLV